MIGKNYLDIDANLLKAYPYLQHLFWLISKLIHARLNKQIFTQDYHHDTGQNVPKTTLYNKQRHSQNTKTTECSIQIQAFLPTNFKTI